MDNVNVDDELEGYIYVFDYDDSYEHEKNLFNTSVIRMLYRLIQLK